MTKPCTRCEVEKPLDDFYPCKRGRLGTTSQCRECMIAAAKARREADPVRQRMYARRSAEKTRLRARENRAAKDQDAQIERDRERRARTLDDGTDAGGYLVPPALLRLFDELNDDTN